MGQQSKGYFAKSERNEETELISQCFMRDKLNESTHTQDAFLPSHIKEDVNDEILLCSPGHQSKLEMTFKPLTQDSQDDHSERRENQDPANLLVSFQDKNVIINRSL